MHIHFTEQQKFNQWWLWLILIVVGIIPMVGLYKQLLLNEPFGDKPMSDTGLIIYAILTLAFLIGFRLLKLKTIITSKTISFRFIPFVKKEINWSDVASATLIDYGFVGGWGIRLWTTYGTVYNVSGSKGLFLQLKNGKKLVIGTQQSDKLQLLLQKIEITS